MARETVIHFKNENIDDINRGIKSGSLKLEKILDDNNQLKFGTCNSSKFSCTLLGASDLTGEEISVYQTVDGIKYKLFSGVITSCVLDKNKVDRNLTAYDKMYTMRKLNVWDWYNQLTFPIPLKDFRDSLFDYLGIVQVTQTLTNDTMLISKTVSQTEMSLETVLTAMCELNGCYGIMNEEGLFEYLDLNNHTIKNISSNVRSSSEYELYAVKRIDCVQLMFEDGDVGVSYGDGSNKYQVIGNFLIYGKTEAELNRIAVNLFSVISDIVVTPANLELIKTDYSLRLGDRVLFTDRFGVEYTTIILKQELSGVQLINESCSCELDEYRTETTSDFESEIRKLMGKSNVLRRDINQTQSTIIDVEKGLQNQITQTANSLSIQISTLGKEISKEYDTYILKEVPTLENYPAIDWHEYLYPGNDTYPGPTTGWFYTYETYFPHLGSVAYVEGTLDSYKFILDENGQFRWKQVQDTQVAYIQEQIHQLQVTDTELSDKIQTNTLTLTAQGERLETAEANIKANSESLTTKISKTTYDKDKANMLSDINSQFQQLSNQISLCVTQKSYDANTVSSMVVEYATSTSPTTAPTYGWSTTAPTAGAGTYMWQRISYRYKDGTTKVSQVTCIQGSKGDTGVSVVKMITYYYLSTSEKTITGGYWTTICPAYTGTVTNPKYYWTQIYTELSDGSKTYSTPQVDYGITGANQTTKTTEAKLALKIDKNDAGTVISMIEGYADVINFKAGSTLRLSSSSRLEITSGSGGVDISTNKLTINTNYFKVKENGVVEITKGVVGGWTLGNGLLYNKWTTSGVEYGVGIDCNKSNNRLLYASLNSHSSVDIYKTGKLSFGAKYSQFRFNGDVSSLPSITLDYSYYDSTRTNYMGSMAIVNKFVAGYQPTYWQSGTEYVNSDTKTALSDSYANIISAKAVRASNFTGYGSSYYYAYDSNVNVNNYCLTSTIINGSSKYNSPSKIVFDQAQGAALVINKQQHLDSSSGSIMYMPCFKVENTGHGSVTLPFQFKLTYNNELEITTSQNYVYRIYRNGNIEIKTLSGSQIFKMSYTFMNGQYGIHFYNKAGSSLAFQEDGNLVIYNNSGNPIWTAGVTNNSSPLP